MKDFLTSDLDFSTKSGGELIRFIVRDYFRNPTSSKPISVAAEIEFKDSLGNVMAYFKPGDTNFSY